MWLDWIETLIFLTGVRWESLCFSVRSVLRKQLRFSLTGRSYGPGQFQAWAVVVTEPGVHDAQHKVKEPATGEEAREYKLQSSVIFLPQDTPEERLKHVDNHHERCGPAVSVQV